MPRKNTKPTSKLSLAELAERRGFTLEPRPNAGMYFILDGGINLLHPSTNALYWTEEEARAFLESDAEPVRTMTLPPDVQRLYDTVVRTKKQR